MTLTHVAVRVANPALLGAVTLEALGVLLDPLRREWRPLPMVLAPGGMPSGRRHTP
ncbi:MAG TPA: hypothetical protein VLI67_02940 [Vicinamibacteria bacterium]|nr:hypothetical protein [Vicinamibacteria bacterium]